MKTPYFCYYSEKTEENIKIFNIFRENDIKVFYAIKANFYKPMIERFIEEGYGFDFASVEEFRFVDNLGVKADLTSFSSPTKLADDIHEVANEGVTRFAFDSEVEARKIMKNVSDPVLFARISTKNEDAVFNLSEKFGMDEDYFHKMIDMAAVEGWPVEGITFHVGSQNEDFKSWKSALKQVEEYIQYAKKQGLVINKLNLGGGIPVQYNNHVEDVETFVKNICELINDFRSKYDLEEVIVEPGRALSANTMDIFTRVVNIKEHKEPTLLIVDSSIFNGLIEPLEHFEYPVLYRGKSESEDTQTYRIGGISCDGYDIIKNKCTLPKDIQLGDLLRIPYAGAYTFVYENFHMRDFPPIIDKDNV